jgi:hypothetical protein
LLPSIQLEKKIQPFFNSSVIKTIDYSLEMEKGKSIKTNATQYTKQTKALFLETGRKIPNAWTLSVLLSIVLL